MVFSPETHTLQGFWGLRNQPPGLSDGEAPLPTPLRGPHLAFHAGGEAPILTTAQTPTARTPRGSPKPQMASEIQVPGQGTGRDVRNGPSQECQILKDPSCSAKAHPCAAGRGDTPVTGCPPALLAPVSESLPLSTVRHTAGLLFLWLLLGLNLILQFTFSDKPFLTLGKRPRSD